MGECGEKEYFDFEGESCEKCDDKCASCFDGETCLSCERGYAKPMNTLM